MTGQIDLTRLPPLPTPEVTPALPIAVDVSAQHELSEATLLAVEQNIRIIQQANQDPIELQSVFVTSPDRYKQALAAAVEAKVRSENHLRQLSEILAQYRSGSMPVASAAASLREITPTDLVQAQQHEFQKDKTAWVRQQRQRITDAVAENASWYDELRRTLKQSQVPEPEFGPQSLRDLQPGDVVLVETKPLTLAHPIESTKESGRDLIRFLDLMQRTLHRVDEEGLAAAVSTRLLPVFHAAVAVRSPDGHLFFLNHVPGGSKVLSVSDFEQEYEGRGFFIARPASNVQGAALWDAVTALKGKGYGPIGEDLVCSESSWLALAKATGLPMKLPDRSGLVDVTPGEFMDGNVLGRYFVVFGLPAQK